MPRIDDGAVEAQMDEIAVAVEVMAAKEENCSSLLSLDVIHLKTVSLNRPGFLPE